MEYLSELKQDNALVTPLAIEKVERLANRLVLTVGLSLNDDIDILVDYLKRPGRGMGGSLMLRSAQIFEENEYTDQELDFAAAIEIMNAAILMVDDWVDESDFRKGQTTPHVKYRNQFAESEVLTVERSQHLADSQAIQLAVLAMHMAGAVVNEKEQPLAARQFFSDNLIQITSGLMLETTVLSRPGIQNKTAVKRVYTNKTGRYSVANPVGVGALAAGADEATFRKLQEASISIGLGFQYQDDLMGIFGNPEATGKPNKDDIEEGFYTAIVNEAKSRMSSSDFEALSIYHGKKISDSQHKEYINLLDRYCIGEHVARLAVAKFELAGNQLDELWQTDWNIYFKVYIESLIGFLMKKDHVSGQEEH